MTKPSIPKGTRDFLPLQARKRGYIFDAIRSIFALYGYDPIETPAMEHQSTLLGKYGEEGDRLIFKVLKRGEKLTEALKLVEDDIYHPNEETGKIDLIKGIPFGKSNPAVMHNFLSDQALRYDLTVPFARFVVQHQHALVFPFKRYQIQPVWRADRPQKGRYREFFQCDVDVIGSESLLSEVELLCIIDEVFAHLGLQGIHIKLNNRKILAGIAAHIGHADQLIPITIAMDKLDKIGMEKVREELAASGISELGIEKLEEVLRIGGAWRECLEGLKGVLGSNKIGLQGIQELEEVFSMAQDLGIPNLELDLSLARGLNYYTGAIIEVGIEGFPSSICGGGRYDDLTGLFGLNNMSGVGISFGADRIYDVLEDRGLFPQGLEQSSRVLFANFGKAEAAYSLRLARGLRKAGVSAEVYPETEKLKKQFAYADAKKIGYVVLIGSDEMQSGLFKVKHLASGEHQEISESQLFSIFKA